MSYAYYDNELRNGRRIGWDEYVRDLNKNRNLFEYSLPSGIAFREAEELCCRSFEMGGSSQRIVEIQSRSKGRSTRVTVITRDPEEKPKDVVAESRFRVGVRFS